MKNREFKDAIFEQIAVIARAFAAPKRLEILDVLSNGEKDVETLARETSSAVANTSRHLQVLKRARLVGSRKQGVRALYRLADPQVLNGYQTLQSLAEDRLAELNDVVRRFFDERDGLEPVPRDELARRASDGDVTVIDVRPVDEYKAGHIKGALSIPLAELQKRLEQIPTEREVVAYCRGPYCVLALEAVEALRRSGRRAFRLQDGFRQWREARLPIAEGRDA